MLNVVVHIVVVVRGFAISFVMVVVIFSSVVELPTFRSQKGADPTQMTSTRQRLNQARRAHQKTKQGRNISPFILRTTCARFFFFEKKHQHNMNSKTKRQLKSAPLLPQIQTQFSAQMRKSMNAEYSCQYLLFHLRKSSYNNTFPIRQRPTRFASFFFVHVSC